MFWIVPHVKVIIILILSLVGTSLEAFSLRCLWRLKSHGQEHADPIPSRSAREVVYDEILQAIASLEGHQLLMLDPTQKNYQFVSPQILNKFPDLIQPPESPSDFFASIGVSLTDEQRSQINNNADSNSYVTINDMSFKVTEDGVLILDNLHPEINTAFSKLGMTFTSSFLGELNITPDGKYAVSKYYISENRETFEIFQINLAYLREHRDEINTYAAEYYMRRGPFGHVERVLPIFSALFSKWNKLPKEEP